MSQAALGDPLQCERVRSSIVEPKLAFVQTLTERDLEQIELDASLCPFAQELLDVRSELEQRGIEVRPIDFKDGNFSRPELRASEIFVFGGRDVMGQWTERLGLGRSVVCSYPSALHDMLHRRIRQGTATELMDDSAGAPRPVFLKPGRPCFLDGHKLQAEICEGVEALSSIPPSLRSERFICSEVVEWMSEYRCYILNSKILGIHCYSMRVPPGWGFADLEQCIPEIRPTEQMVQAAVNRLDEAGQSVAGYCLDFGLIAFGEMALIEMNDGIALTNYGISPADYLYLHLARWQELVEASGR